MPWYLPDVPQPRRLYPFFTSRSPWFARGEQLCVALVAAVLLWAALELATIAGWIW